MTRIIRLCTVLTVALSMPFILSSVSAQSKSPRGMDFRQESAGRTGGHGAEEIEFARFKSQEGSLVEQFVERYKTEQKAQLRLRAIADRASKVIERGKKIGSDGRELGDRIRVASSDSHGQPLQATAWINGSKVFVLTSACPDCLQEFEQQFYP